MNYRKRDMGLQADRQTDKQTDRECIYKNGIKEGERLGEGSTLGGNCFSRQN